MSPSRAWDGSPIVSPFLSQSEAKSKNQEAKRALIPQKHRIISAKRHEVGGTSGALSQPLSGT